MMSRGLGVVVVMACVVRLMLMGISAGIGVVLARLLLLLLLGWSR